MAKKANRSIDENIDSEVKIDLINKKLEELRRKGAALSREERDQKIELTKELKKINKELERQNELSISQLDNWKDVDTSLISIGNILGKTSKEYKLQAEKIEKTKQVTKSLSSVLQKNSNFNKSDQKQLSKILKAYKQNNQSITEATRLRAEGTINEQEYYDIVEKSRKTWGNILSTIELTEDAQKAIKEQLENMNKEVHSFANASDKANQSMQALDTTLDQIGGSGIPMMRELTDVLKKAKENGAGLRLALIAAGAAAGVLATKYFGAEFIARIQAGNDILQSQIETARDVSQIKFETKFIPEKTRLEINKMLVQSEFERAKAVKKINDLQNKGSVEYKRVLQAVNKEIESGVVQFNAASKTALFGKGIGSVNYAKEQLVAAGVSAEDVANNIKQAGVVMGQMPSAETATTMALMEKRTGVSAESIAQISKSFVRIDGLSETAALNMQEGMRQLAMGSKIPLDNLMQEVAASAKQMLGYGIKNTVALTKQVAAVQSMGASFQAVANAGRSMVLNYKDSIKAEMQLSSLMGEQVDLSEARAAFAAGDYQSAISAIQAQGLDIADMNQFQLEALSQSLGGMDIDTMTSILTGKMQSPQELKAASAKAGGQEFAAAKLAEKQEMSIGSAIIEARDAKLQIQFDKEIQKEILNAPFYAQFQKNQAEIDAASRALAGAMDQAWKATEEYVKSVAALAQLDIERSFTEKLPEAIGGLLGGLGGNFIFGKMMGGKGGKGFQGIPNPFKRTKIETPTTKPTIKPTIAPEQLLDKSGKPLKGAARASRADKLAREAAKQGTESIATKAGQKLATETAEKAVTKTATKGIAKTAGKGLGKSLLKKIPLVGLGAGLLFATQRLMEGDYVGAGLEVSSGAASLIPGAGTATSIGIDAAIAARDIKKETDAANALTNTTVSVTKPKTPAVTADITKTAQTTNTWLQDKLIYMSGNLERVVARADKLVTYNSNISKYTGESSQKLTELTNNTSAILQLTRVMEALAAEEFFRQTGEKQISLKVDGKTLAVALDRFKQNNQAQRTPKGGAEKK